VTGPAGFLDWARGFLRAPRIRCLSHPGTTRSTRPPGNHPVSGPLRPLGVLAIRLHERQHPESEVTLQLARTAQVSCGHRFRRLVKRPELRDPSDLPPRRLTCRIDCTFGGHRDPIRVLILAPMIPPPILAPFLPPLMRLWGQVWSRAPRLMLNPNRAGHPRDRVRPRRLGSGQEFRVIRADRRLNTCIPEGSLEVCQVVEGVWVFGGMVMTVFSGSKGKRRSAAQREVVTAPCSSPGGSMQRTVMAPKPGHGWRYPATRSRASEGEERNDAKRATSYLPFQRSMQGSVRRTRYRAGMSRKSFGPSVYTRHGKSSQGGLTDGMSQSTWSSPTHHTFMGAWLPSSNMNSKAGRRPHPRRPGTLALPHTTTTSLAVRISSMASGRRLEG